MLVETTLLRRNAAAKFDDPADWLFTDEALQQATAEPVAAHRARRLAGATVHDVTCSIGTELAALRNSTAIVVGSDIDPVRLAMARHNVPEVTLCRADALRPVTRDTVVLLDPARRSGGRRRFDPRDYTPATRRVARRVPRSRHRRKVCAGNRFRGGSRLGFAGEIEVTSLAGECARGVPVVGGAGGSGRDPTGHDARHADEEITERRSRRLRGGTGRPVDRRPRRRGGARRSGASLRAPGTACGSSTPTSPTCRATDCRTGCAVSRCSRNSATANDGCARRFRLARSAQSRSWCAASTSTPTCCGRGCGCADRASCRW